MGATDSSPEERLREYRATGDVRLRNAVVEDHRWLARVLAREYFTGSEPIDDLVQVACLALLKAAERFDPDYGAEFTAFAATTARGELRRHYRDALWAVKVPRRTQELRYDVRAATEVLEARLRRAPTTAELADYLGVAAADVVDAHCAARNFRSLSLDSPTGRTSRLGASRGDADLERVEADEAFDKLVATLPERLQHVVRMRFVDQMSQSVIARHLGVSQVQVSRLLAQAMGRLRVVLDGRAGAASTQDATTVASAAA